ncbi:MAG: hypothetical protein Fur0034_20890 [Desulfuromonadia bacterium]
MTLPKILVVLLLTPAVLLCIAAVAGSLRWAAGTEAIRQRLERGRLPISPAVVDFRELEGLPAPVERFFRTVLTDGMPMVSGVRISHGGSLNMGEAEERWRPFVSDQRVVAKGPGFDWNARVSLLPGVPVWVHDCFVDGEGILNGAIYGLFPVVEMRGGGPIAEGELIRFVAEAPWYPTVLLPSQGVRWEPKDDRSARLSLVEKGVRVSLTIFFDQEGRIGSVRSEGRGRTVGKEIVPTPWVGRFGEYRKVEGMVVPMDGEVAWVTPEGEKPYWRGRIREIRYEYAR